VDVEAIVAESSARNYLTYIDSEISSNAIATKVTWNESCGHWEFFYKSKKDSVLIEVDPKQMRVTKFRR
jgi:hypothetical protein